MSVLLHTPTCPACTIALTPHVIVCPGCGRVLNQAELSYPSGQTLVGGRYTIQGKLAQGGMGTLYLATDQHAFDRTMVLKVLADDQRAAHTQEAVAAQQRLADEARIPAFLKHPDSACVCLLPGGTACVHRP